MESEAAKFDRPKFNRRWFQFSLRALLIFVVIAAIACGCLARKVERKRRERETVRAIEMSPSVVVYDYQAAKLNEPFGPAWLRDLLGENFFSEVTEVELNLAAEDDEIAVFIGSIEDFPYLTELRLCTPSLTDAGLAKLKGLTQLKDLTLLESNVSNTGIADIQKALPNCKIYH